MKKFYLSTLALMAFLASSLAQPTAPNCTGTPGAVITPWNGFCVIVAQGLAANAEVHIYNGLTEVFPLTGTAPNTGPDGKVEVQINCSQNVTRIVSCVAGVGCCGANVAPLAPMPVKLTSFTGRLQTDYSATLDWTSVMEFESSKYEVERSADGKNFVKVGELKAAGSSITAIKYSFTDPLPGSGAYFYRLKQIDFDETSEYSKVVYVNSKKGSGIVTKVFPNPFNSEIQLIGATSGDMTPGNIKVFTITGQMVKFRIVGANAIAIDEGAPKGMYIVKFKDQTFKLSKQL
jgi:hypothetical protein